MPNYDMVMVLLAGQQPGRIVDDNVAYLPNAFFELSVILREHLFSISNQSFSVLSILKLKGRPSL
jgi:hypothetical protein